MYTLYALWRLLTPETCMSPLHCPIGTIKYTVMLQRANSFVECKEQEARKEVACLENVKVTAREKDRKMIFYTLHRRAFPLRSKARAAEWTREVGVGWTHEYWAMRNLLDEEV